MSEFNPFIFDPSHESYIGTRILPYFPLKTSYDIGWNGVRADIHRQPPWEAMEHSLSHHTIVIHHSQQPIQAERMLDGRIQDEQESKGLSKSPLQKYRKRQLGGSKSNLPCFLSLLHT